MDDNVAFEQSGSTTLTKAKLLLVEGRDDEGLFGALFAHLGGMPEIEIRKYDGKDNLRPYLRTLKMVRGFSAVTSIGIIRDADENAAGAFQSVRDTLVNEDLPAPTEALRPSTGSPTTTIAVLPIGETEGELEDLLLTSVNTDPAISCVDEYITCLETQGLKLPNKLSKARLHAFLASREQPNLLIGQAARAGYFLWDTPPFANVIQFVRTL